MKSPNIGKLLESKKATIILSVVLAVIFWFVVVVYFDPEGTVTIDDVPIQVNTTSTQAQRLGLEVSSVEPKTVDLQLEGKMYKMGGLTKDDFNVSATLSGVTSADTYVLDLSATPKVAANDYKIVNLNPTQVTVMFDTVLTKTVTLEASAPNVKVDDGYLLESASASPEVLEVRGPEQYIDQLDRIVLYNDESIKATTTQTLNAKPKFYAEDGTELDGSYFEYNNNIQFSITLPVYKQKTVPLTFKYKNAPSTLDTSKLQYTISPEEISVAGASESMDALTEINLGYIDFRELDIGKTFQFNVPIPSGYKNLDNVTQATVTFQSDGWSSKLVNVNDIRIVNQPEGVDISIVSQEIADVKIVGFSDVVNSIGAEDLVATIDFSTLELQKGTQTVNVSIDVVSKDGVWEVGTYTCTVKIT